MPIVSIVFILGLFYFFFKGKGDGVAPPDQFNSSSGANGSNSITVDNSSITGVAPKPIQNQDGTVTIKATITSAKAQTIASQLISEFAEWTTEEEDVILAIMQAKNDADYALVFDAFGEHGSGLLTQRLDDSIASFNKRNLTAWITGAVEDPYNKRRLHARFPTVF